MLEWVSAAKLQISGMQCVQLLLTYENNKISQNIEIKKLCLFWSKRRVIIMMIVVSYFIGM